MPNLDRLIHQTFQLDDDLVLFEINRQLRDLYLARAVLATDDCSFDIETFVRDGRCSVWPLDDLAPLFFADWKGRDAGVALRPKQAFYEVLWNGHLLQCLSITRISIASTSSRTRRGRSGRRFSHRGSVGSIRP